MSSEDIIRRSLGIRRRSPSIKLIVVEKLSEAILAKFPSMKERMRELGLSNYEVVAYAALAGLRDEAKVGEVLYEAQKYGNLPPTRVYAVLTSLERKGLISKSYSYPKKYRALVKKEPFKDFVKSTLDSYRRRLESDVDSLWNEFLGPLQHVAGVWQIGTEEEATALTEEMWKNASVEIDLMTESGRWVMNSKRLLDILVSKKEFPSFRINVLLSKGDQLSKTNREIASRFEEFLGQMGGNVYRYIPGALRMDIVDKKSCLFFMYEEDKPYIYYSTHKSIADSLRQLFILSILLTEKYESTTLNMLGDLLS